MKKTLTLLTLAAAGLTATAATPTAKVDLGSRARLRAASAPVEFVKTGDGNASGRKRAKAAKAPQIVNAFITLNDAGL